MRVALAVAVAFSAVAYVWTLMNWERTLVIIKPDGYQRGLREHIYSRLEKELGLRLVTESVLDLASSDQLAQHYAEHRSRDFYGSLVEFMQSGPIAVSVWLGKPGTVQAVRKLIGTTDPSKSPAGTIRAEFGTSGQKNVIHASDSVDSAAREIEIWFR